MGRFIRHPPPTLLFRIITDQIYFQKPSVSVSYDPASIGLSLLVIVKLDYYSLPVYFPARGGGHNSGASQKFMLFYQGMNIKCNGSIFLDSNVCVTWKVKEWYMHCIMQSSGLFPIEKSFPFPLTSLSHSHSIDKPFSF